MLVKWIAYDVPEERREQFDRAQLGWRRIRYVDGLVVRVGGHALEGGGASGTLSVWRDEASHDRFMEIAHDAVAEVTGLGDVGVKIEESIYHVFARIPGQRPKLYDALAAGQLLRLTWSEVKPEAQMPHAVAELDVWTKGMATAKGMYGGICGRRKGEVTTFLRATSWQDEELHRLYEEHFAPDLRARSGAEDTASSTTTRCLALERHWTVIGVG